MLKTHKLIFNFFMLKILKNKELKIIVGTFFCNDRKTIKSED